MSALDVLRIKGSLEKQFRPFIDISDVKDRPDPDQENHFLTRALATYALTILADVDPVIASASVTDGYEDNGLDLVHYERTAKVLYLIQSKWVKSGDKGIEAGDAHKFCAGVKDLVNGDFERFNAKIKSREREIMDALMDGDTKIVLVIVYTGKQKLHPSPNRVFRDLLRDMNSSVEAFTLEPLNLSRIYEAVIGQVGGKSIDSDITLCEFGTTTEPYQVWYGQLSATTVAKLFETHRSNLFSKNLRNYRGSTEVNAGIQKTLENQPETFLYLNNGLTVLCSRIKKKPLSGSHRAIGIFECKGISIVNGAQTVGSIAAVYAKHPDKVDKAHVLVRLLSLEDCPEGFGDQVTLATNTQNRVERVDFVAMDPEQKRLRTELLLEQKEYAYKSGDALLTEGCTVTDATVALACAHSDLALAVQAKREVGKLWEMGPKTPYKKLFNPSVTGIRLWRAVEVMHAVDEELKAVVAGAERKTQLVAVHGNRFILHRVFAGLPATALEEPTMDFPPILATAGASARAILTALVKAVQTDFSKAYPANLFKNLSKCRALDKSLTA